MSVNVNNKCYYSKRYYPLVKFKQIELTKTVTNPDGSVTTDDSLFKLYLLDKFQDGEKVYTDIVSGTNSSAAGSSYKPEPKKNVDGTGRIRNGEDSSNIGAFYMANDGQRRIMERQFKIDITGLSLLKIDFNTNAWDWINANANPNVNNLSQLNINIFKYKADLLNKLGPNVIVSPTMNPDEFEQLVNDRCKEIRDKIDAGEDIDDKTYDAYVILSNFDHLLEQLTPFVRVKRGYENLSRFDKYEYVGPNVKHFTNFTSGKNADFAASEEQVSDLAKILLDIIPECSQENGVLMPVINTGIGLSGFDASMCAIKNAIKSGSLLKFAENNIDLEDPDRDAKLDKLKSDIETFNNGLDIKLGDIIDDYIDIIGNAPYSKNDKHRTYLLSKLRGIRKFICDTNTPAYIKNMFYAMFFKTEPISYRGYQIGRGDDSFTGKALEANFVNTQDFYLQDLVNGAVSRLKRSREFALNLKSKYNISFKDGSISFSKDNQSATIDYSSRNNTYEFVLDGASDKTLIHDLVLDVLSYIIPDTYDSCIPMNEGQSTEEDFAALLGVTLLSSKRSFGEKANANFKRKSNGQLALSEIGTKRNEMASRLSVIYGSEVRNIVKSPTGSSLPLYQLSCLNHNIRGMMYDLDHAVIDGYESCYSENLLMRHKDLLGISQIRSDVVLNGLEKSVDKLTTKELLQIAIIDDFANELKNGKIYLQNATFADKGTHFLQEYNVDAEIEISVNGKYKTTTLRNLIEGISKAKNRAELDADVETMSEVIRDLRKKKINAVASNIIKDYEAVYGTAIYGGKTPETLIEKLEAIDKAISKKTINEVKTDFARKRVKFYEEIHAYSPKNSTLGNCRINETILSWLKTFNNKAAWDARVKANRQNFIKALNGGDDPTTNLRMNRYQDPRVESLKPSKANTDFADLYEDISGDLWFAKGDKMLPMVEAFFMTDMLLSNEFNSLAIGEVYAHPNKNKNLTNIPGSEGYDASKTSGTYEEFSEANRLIAQIKRSVIFGATMHPFMQHVRDSFGIDRGVSEKIAIAVFKDIPSATWNIIGEEKSDNDSWDGSGLQLQIQSRLENNSLIDARVGDENKKTILADNDPRYGRPTLLKWAVYALTNEVRRNSYRSKVSGELLVKKMMSQQIELSTDKIAKAYEEYGKKIVYKDISSGKFYRIESIDYEQNRRILTELDENGNVVANNSNFVEDKPIVINNLYDVDVLFGGAWAGEFDGTTFKYTDGNNDMLEDLVCKYNLKDKFIAYAVNKSAIKVGAGEVNSVDRWSNDEALQTISMSTKYGGVQMDADHHLDEAEVTEMTQMISALIEDGHYTNVVLDIYTDIGQILQEKLKGFIAEVHDPAKKQELYVRLAKSLIESFEGGSKDTIGLAQAFVKKASKSLRDGDFKFKLPFSAATISGAFISDVASTINKKGIRHKYEGFAGVLNPSYDMIQYYSFNVNGVRETVLFEQAADICRKYKWSIDDLTKFKVNGKINPFAKQISKDDIDFEDTIVVIDEAGNETYERIDSLSKYYRWKHELDLTNYKIYNITSAPRNLRQGSTEFTVDVDGKEVHANLYDLDTVRAAFYIKNANDKNFKKNPKYNELLTWANSVVENNNPKKRLVNLSTETIFEQSDKGYGGRTEENAKLSDITLLYAVDTKSKGTNVMRDAAGDKVFEYYNKGTVDQNADNFVKKLKTLGLFEKEITLNVAGNRLSTFERMHIEGKSTQQEIDAEMAAFIKALLDRGVKFKLIRSGGQTGADEAGIKAARMLNIRSVVRAPKGWLMEVPSVKNGKIEDYTSKSEKKFKSRFEGLPVGTVTKWLGKELSEMTTEEKLKILSGETQRITKTFDYAVKESTEIEQGKRAGYSKLSIFNFRGQRVHVKKHWMRPHECITGRYQWDKLGLTDADNMNDIFRQKAKFFEDRIKSKHEVVDVSVQPGVNPNTLYDLVLYKNGEQFLIKFGDVPNEFNLSSDPDFIINNKRIGSEDDVLYNGKYICKSDDKRFFIHTDASGQQHKVITVKSKEAFEDLLDSGIFSDFYRINYTENNKQLIADYTEEPIDVTKSAEVLTKEDSKRVQVLIERLAEEQFEAFKQLQYYVGARIPTQAMQSFMPMKVVAVTNCKTNQIYVPRSQTWLEGSDYDIDKLYILVHSLDDNGKISLGSALQSKFGLNVVSKLVRPNGIRYEAGTGGYVLNAKIAESIANFDGSERIMTRPQFANILNDIYRSSSNIITFDESGVTDLEAFEKIKKRVLWIVNRHSMSNSRIVTSENAIKNRVVEGTLNIVRSPQNQKSALIPINMDEQQAAAGKSTLGATEKHLTSDNAAAKFIMQEQNMIGKAVIGITAVSLKTFFAISAYYGKKVDTIVNSIIAQDMNSAVAQLNSILIQNPITKKKTVLSNLDLEKIEDAAYTVGISLENEPALELGAFDPTEIENNTLKDSIEILKERSSRTDAALVISGLLSAATDNAKELILAKINATPELVDIYTYLAMIGMTFDEIADIMTSPIFNQLTDIASVNIFDRSTHNYKVKQSIDFMLGNSLLKGTDRDVLWGLIDSMKNSGLPVKDILTIKEVTTTDEISGKTKTTKTVTVSYDDIVKVLKNDAWLNALLKKVKDSIGIRPSSEISENEPEEEMMISGESGNENVTSSNNRRRFVDLTSEEKVNLYRNLERWKRRNEFIKSQKDTSLQQIAAIVSGTEEMSTLGGTLGINQGTKTDLYGQYSFIMRIENFINDKIKTINKEITKSNKKLKKSTPRLPNFDLIQFLSNDDVKQYWINLYETYPTLKTSFNILDVVTTVPHFSQMINMVEVLDTALNTLSARYRIVMNGVRDFCESRNLTQLGRNEFKEFERYVGDTLIAQYLISKGNQWEFKLPIGQTYHTSFANQDVVRVSGQTLRMNNVWDIASFKRLMEDHVIPTLKQQYPGNKFLELLGFTEEPESYRGEKRTYYKLPFAMSSIEDSPNTEALYNTSIAAFKSISGDKFEGFKIADWFYLYNMIVNKDAFGDHSLTRIFEDLAASDNSTSIVADFNQFLSSMDYGLIPDIMLNLDEVNWRICKNVKETTVKNTSGIATDLKLSEDFTLDLPFTFNYAFKSINDSRKPDYNSRVIALNGYEITTALAANINDLYTGGKDIEGFVHLIDDSDFDASSDSIVKDIPQARFASAFIYNGEVYINTSSKNYKWTTQMHELAHLVLATMKVTDLKNGNLANSTYYQLLSQVKQHPQYDTFAYPYLQVGRDTGSDIDEEVLCKLIEQHLAGYVDSREISAITVRKSQSILKAIAEMFKAKSDKKLTLNDLVNKSIEENIAQMASDLFFTDSEMLDSVNVILSQGMKSAKTKMIDDNTLEYKCKNI